MTEIKITIPNWILIYIFIALIWTVTIGYLKKYPIRPKKEKCEHIWKVADECCLKTDPPEYIHTYVCNKCDQVKFAKDHNSIAELEEIHKRAQEALKREG